MLFRSFRIEKKFEIFSQSESKLNFAFALYLQYKHELQLLDKNQLQYNIVQSKFIKQRVTLHRLRNNHYHCEKRLRPTHAVIEKVLKIPKGSVGRILKSAEKDMITITTLLDPLKNQC